jgi:hypothetical protein
LASFLNGSGEKINVSIDWAFGGYQLLVDPTTSDTTKLCAVVQSKGSSREDTVGIQNAEKMFKDALFEQRGGLEADDPLYLSSDDAAEAASSVITQLADQCNGPGFKLGEAGSSIRILAEGIGIDGATRLELSVANANGALTEQIDSGPDGTSIKQYDPNNTHPYNELDVSIDRAGQITAAQMQLEQNIIAAGGSVGQIFGSALGRALAPNNQFAQLAVGTVAGLIGQKLLQTFTASLTVDASRFVVGDFASVSGLDVATAGLGAISSFLTAELGRGLGLTGFGAELFNGAVGGVTGSVLTQVATKVAAGYSFDAAVGFINWSTAATQAGYNVSAAVGSFLAHQFVHPESHEGAVGGQLFGAVGSALGLAAVINASLTGILGFLIPGLGSFFGTIVGTMLGDAIAGDPVYPMAYHDVRILGSDYHFTNRLVGTDNHGNAAVSEEMGDQVTTIANSYLDAVHGVGIAYSGKVMTGYNAGAAPYQYITGWFPNGTEVAPHFANAADAIQEGVRELLMNTEAIGGDLLMKRAHQAFIHGPHRSIRRRVKARETVRACGWRRRVQRVSTRTSAFAEVSSSGRLHSQNERYETKLAIA